MFFSIVLSTLSASATYFLVNKKNISNVSASAFVTLVLCLLIQLFLDSPESSQQLAFGASFIGMSSSEKFRPYKILLAAILMALVCSYVLVIFPSIGGVLGLLAFVLLYVLKKL